MRIAKSLIAKIFTFFCTLAGIPLIFSCGEDGNTVTKPIEAPVMYGMPPNYGYISGTVKGDSDGNGTTKPLANVKIYSESENFKHSGMPSEDGLIYQTSGDGRYFIDLWEKGQYTFRFEDGDGIENGSFKTQKKTFSWQEGTELTDQDITLEPDE